MKVYLDASAAVKLVTEEAESAALASYLDRVAPDDVVMSASILETEMRRHAVREGIDQQLVTAQLSQIGLVLPERSDFVEAGIVPIPGLRSLDALHIVTALRADADVLVAYDVRLIDAARSLGLVTVSPA